MLAHVINMLTTVYINSPVSSRMIMVVYHSANNSFPSKGLFHCTLIEK